MKLISFGLFGLVMMFAVAVRGGSARVETPAVPEAACASDAADVTAIGPAMCGSVICGKNQHCCNASCGKCAPIGVECPQIACAGGDGDGDGGDGGGGESL
jgi:hypothetical protein